MSETTKHTPIPWVFAYGSIYRADTLNDESSIRIALMDRNEAHTTPTERDANAELIARAVNSHDELLEACQTMVSLVESGHLVCNVSKDSEPGWALNAIGLVKSLSKARKAIDKATQSTTGAHT